MLAFFNKISEEKRNTIAQAVCISLALTVAVILYWVLGMKYGYWIVLTVSIIYAFPQQGIVIKRTFDRVLGTFIGLLLGFGFAAVFPNHSHILLFFLPLIWFGIFYINLLTSNYWLSSTLVTLFIPLCFVVFFKIDVHLLLIDRILCTALGAAIALVAQYAIFRKSTGTFKRFEDDVKVICSDIADVIDNIAKCFIGEKKMNRDLQKVLREIMTKIVSIENLYSYAKYEFGDKKKREEFYTNFFRNIFGTLHYLRKLIAISKNDQLDTSLLQLDELKDIVNFIIESYKYENLIAATSKTGFESKIAKIMNGEVNSTTFFLDGLVKLQEKANGLRALIREAHPD